MAREITERMKYMILDSFLRWISGLKPKHGKRYYFMIVLDKKSLRDIIDRYAVYRIERICPICNKKRLSPFSYYMHITSHAPNDLWRLIEPYV